MMFTFSVLDQKQVFLTKCEPKYRDCQFRLEFGTLINSDIQNSMVVFTFSVLDQKYLFCANMVQKIKILSLT